MMLVFHAVSVGLSLLFYAADQVNAREIKTILLLVLASLLRCFSILSCNLFQIYTQEIYPGQIRVTGAGFASGMSVLGGFAALFVAQFAQDVSIQPIGFLALLAAVGLISISQLRETYKKPLQLSVYH